jgi:serine/threonine protein phosphatase 1
MLDKRMDLIRTVIPMPPRTIAIGDIHGCSLALAALVAAIDPKPDDVIVTLGDYINRGPDSRGVVEQLIALGRRCRLVPILGNHDQMLLDALNSRDYGFWFRHWGNETLASYEVEAPEEIPPEPIAFLTGCRDYYETATHIFVHAGYDPERPMDEQSERWLRWESLRDRIPAPHLSGKTVIVGHTSQRSGEILDLGYLKCIDTYCHGGGWLTALEVSTGQVWQADREGRLR